MTGEQIFLLAQITGMGPTFLLLKYKTKAPVRLLIGYGEYPDLAMGFGVTIGFSWLSFIVLLFAKTEKAQKLSSNDLTNQ